KLKETLTLVIEWLKFAEAKNAGLLVLNSGSIIGIAAAYKDLYEVPNHSCLKFAIVLFVICSFCSLWNVIESISAKYNPNEIPIWENKSPNSLNLIFFGDLAQLSAEQVVSEMQTQYTLTHSENKKLELHLANQIVINSNIALQKFILFNKAMHATKVAFLVATTIALIGELYSFLSLSK
ncbi:MAG: Pycsar system effector family protein, partial [Bacteroidia bacterium]